MNCKSYSVILFRLALILLWAEFIVSESLNNEATQQSVGKIRSSADVAFANGDMNEALKLWNKVIEMEPKNDNNFYRRFRIYLRLQKLKEALADLNSALSIKADNTNALLQRAKLYMKMGKCSEAESDYMKLKSLEPQNTENIKGWQEANQCSLAIKEAEKAFENQQWERSKHFLTTALKWADHSVTLLLKKAICSFSLEDYYETISETGKLLKFEADNIFALEIRGKSYYQLGEIESAMNHYRMGLKYDPEHDGCKKAYRNVKKIRDNIKKSDEAFQKEDWENAIKALNILKDSDSRLLNIRAYLDLSSAYRGINKLEEAISYAKKVIENDRSNVEGYKRLADALVDKSEFDEAIKVLRRGDEVLGGNQDIQEAIRKVEAALKQSKQKDYYKILGVSRNAKLKEIKKSYREMALIWHPDKHTGEEEKTKAEAQFQLVAEAYEVLSDQDLRGKYDRGEEVFANQGGGQQQQHGFNPFGHQGGQQHFHHFFHHG